MPIPSFITETLDHERRCGRITIRLRCLGAAKTVSGWPEVASLFDWLAHNFSKCLAYDLDVSAAGVSGDLGYIVGSEHTTASVGGEKPLPYALRVTLIFRREDGEWKEVHRHADPMPGVESTHEQLNRLK